MFLFFFCVYSQPSELIFFPLLSQKRQFLAGTYLFHRHAVKHSSNERSLLLRENNTEMITEDSNKFSPIVVLWMSCLIIVEWELWFDLQALNCFVSRCYEVIRQVVQQMSMLYSSNKWVTIIMNYLSITAIHVNMTETQMLKFEATTLILKY